MLEKPNKPQVDIIIICYNQENFISETIESAINQSYINFKIIIADDCSTDQTRKVIDRWFKKYPEKIIRVYNQRNLGITCNSNEALKKSKGDYFIIIGGDDVLYPERLNEQVNWFLANPNAYLCGHRLDYIDANSSIIPEFDSVKKGRKGNKNWIRSGMIYGCISLMYRKDKRVELRYDERLYYVSDLKFCIDFLGDSREFGFINKYLAAYRRTDQSITISKWRECLDDCNKMFEILKHEKKYNLHTSIKKGQNYLVTYSAGVFYFRKGKYSKSIQNFIEVIKFDLGEWKALIRLIQVVLTVLYMRAHKSLVLLINSFSKINYHIQQAFSQFDKIY